MSIPLRQSTASQEAFLGVFVDATDGFTPETGLTIANTDVKLGICGTTTLANKNSGGGTHISGGIYSIVFDATDTATVGGLDLFCTISGARPIQRSYIVYPANIYDSLFAGTDLMAVDVDQIDGSATAATRQSLLLLSAINGTTVQASPAPTTTSFAGALTGGSFGDNCFRNAAIVFTSGALSGLTPHVCTSFTSSSGLFVVPTLPVAPTAGDTFLIVGVAI